jgi:hypothetical protein
VRRGSDGVSEGMGLGDRVGGKGTDVVVGVRVRVGVGRSNWI